MVPTSLADLPNTSRTSEKKKNLCSITQTFIEESQNKHSRDLFFVFRVTAVMRLGECVGPSADNVTLAGGTENSNERVL